MADNTILDLDALLETNMDNVETLPDFVNPPAGVYMLKVEAAEVEKYKNKEQKDQARLKIRYVTQSTIELADSKELPVKDGSLFSESFMATEEGIKYFKRQALNIMNVDDAAGATLKDLMQGLIGTEFKAKISIRRTPNPAGGTYENVQVRPVWEAAA
jgi:hypothetical protein